MKIVSPWILLVCLVCGLCAAVASGARAQQTGTQPRPAQTPAAQDEIQEGVTSRVVRVPVTVTDKKGQPVTGLTRNDFMVFEDKRPIQFDFLGESQEMEKQPIFIGVLMDTSGSTAGKLGFEKEAAKNFLYTVTRTRKDQAAFVTFDDAVMLRQDFTKNLDLLEKAIDNVKKPGTQTALYDAVWQFCDEKMRNASSTRRALVVITDGDDTYSRARLPLPPAPPRRRHPDRAEDRHHRLRHLDQGRVRRQRRPRRRGRHGQRQRRPRAVQTRRRDGRAVLLHRRHAGFGAGIQEDRRGAALAVPDNLQAR